MPSWKFHLSIAKRINKEIRVNENDFLIGNIVPNFLCGEIVKSIYILNYDAAHFLENKKIDLDKFYFTFKKQIKTKPLILGYFVHLIIDDFFNKKFEDKLIYGKTNLAGFKINNDVFACSLEKAHYIKKYDFIYYDEKFNNSLPKLFITKNIISQLKLLENIIVTSNELNKLIDYVKETPKIKKRRCLMFSEIEIDELFEECIEYVIKYLKHKVKILQ